MVNIIVVWYVWVDFDMFEVGNGGMLKDEYIVYFSIWVIFKVMCMEFLFFCMIWLLISM